MSFSFAAESPFFPTYCSRASVYSCVWIFLSSWPMTFWYCSSMLSHKQLRVTAVVSFKAAKSLIDSHGVSSSWWLFTQLTCLLRVAFSYSRNKSTLGSLWCPSLLCWNLAIFCWMPLLSPINFTLLCRVLWLDNKRFAMTAGAVWPCSSPWAEDKSYIHLFFSGKSWTWLLLPTLHKHILFFVATLFLVGWLFVLRALVCKNEGHRKWSCWLASLVSLAWCFLLFLVACLLVAVVAATYHLVYFILSYLCCFFFYPGYLASLWRCWYIHCLPPLVSATDLLG